MASNWDKEKKQREELERLLHRLQQLVYNNYMLTFALPSVKKAVNTGNDGFFFAHDATANKEVNRLLTGMTKQMDYLLLNGIERSWKQGNENFWDELQLTFSKSAREKKAFDQIRETATQSARDHTAKAFYNEKRDKGLNISDRVWNLAGNAKKEIEIILQNGIKDGKSAEEIQKSLKGYLNEPDKLFRRVRNKETGELELSKAAQKYKPGQGVYRSAYANAMRLARTEIKAAYCEAAWNSAQNNPLITGWRIVLSNNHTTLIKGEKVPLKDICDDLQGVYPKSFKFRGWHPQCRCDMLPVTITQAESRDLYKSIFDGKRDHRKPKQITRVPKEFTDWVHQNADRIEKANNRGTLPYFLRDNATFAGMKGNQMPHINRGRIKELRAWAKENLAGKEVYHHTLENKILFTVTGLKEYLNQPFGSYFEKNEAVKNIAYILQNATYKGFTEYNKSNNSVLYSHIFETEAIGKIKSWLIVRENTNGTITFHSISDNEKVLTGLKRK